MAAESARYYAKQILQDWLVEKIPDGEHGFDLDGLMEVAFPHGRFGEREFKEILLIVRDKLETIITDA